MATKKSTAWAVIRNPANGAYLLCRRAPKCNNAGQWGFPGGGVDAGEYHHGACQRETAEEIGVGLPIFAFCQVARKDYMTWFEVFKYVEPKATAEVDEWAWVMPPQFHHYDLHKSVKKYFAALKQCAA